MRTRAGAAAAAVAIAVFLLAGTAGATSSTTTVHRMKSVATDLKAVSTAAGNQDLVALSSACSDLSDDATILLGGSRPSSIGKKAWSYTRTAMVLFVQAGDTCVAGADQYDGTKISQAASLIDQGSSYVTKANALL